jgi:hypothetical protein
MNETIAADRVVLSAGATCSTPFFCWLLLGRAAVLRRRARTNPS